jgi:predicted nucleotidyltransferase
MAVPVEKIEQGRDFLVSQGATFVLLFGSAAESPETARDLDLACEGIPPERFYEVAGRIMMVLDFPVDLVDLSDNTRFTRYIRSKGRVLYGN